MRKRKKKPVKLPAYCQHKHSGQAVVYLDGQQVYLGKYGSDASWSRYHRVLAEWQAHGRVLAAPQEEVTVNEVLLAYLRHARDYYATPEGEPGKEYECILLAVKPLRRLYGRTLARDFGPRALLACREEFLRQDITRGSINHHVQRIKRVFRWASQNELIPAQVWYGIHAVEGLKKGRSGARESKPRKPAPVEHVEAVLPLVSAQVAAMIRLQLLTGMRPGEVMQMRPGDIDRSEDIWVYRPERHKTDHHGHDRVVPLGPGAQKILEPFLDRSDAAVLFSPKEAERARNARRRLRRVTPMTPSQAKRKPKKNLRRKVGDVYDAASYRRAVTRACKKAGVPVWTPYQLRHTAATELRKRYGAEAAQILLGHRHLRVTEIYAERDMSKAKRIMGEVG